MDDGLHVGLEVGEFGELDAVAEFADHFAGGVAVAGGALGELEFVAVVPVDEAAAEAIFIAAREDAFVDGAGVQLGGDDGRYDPAGK